MPFRVAVCSLNQWALDFQGNVSRIHISIKQALQKRAIYRSGPELELCGYSLEDEFFNNSIISRCWTELIKLLDHYKNENIIIDIGMPVFNLVLYNCRVVGYKGKILCIRAKTSLANGGNYRECRHFKPWTSGLVPYQLPLFVRHKLNQDCVPFGANFIMQLSHPTKFDSFRIGWEICQELWDSKSVSNQLYQDFRCHLVLNSSASYWELRKLNDITKRISETSSKGLGCYAFSNLVGNDGQRYVFYGRSCIFDRGELKCITEEFHGLKFCTINSIVYDIDAKELDNHRSLAGTHIGEANTIKSPFDLRKFIMDEKCSLNPECNTLLFHLDSNNDIDPPAVVHNLPRFDMNYQQEIAYYVPLWLWDYLRRSRMKGFIVPLSGGLDSASVATLVYQMCKLISESESSDLFDYFSDVHQTNLDSRQLHEPKELCKRLLRCCYLSTNYSSETTSERARCLSESIGAEFININFQYLFEDAKTLTGQIKPSTGVTLLEQNLQARLRMVLTYGLSDGNRLVLSTGNVDEALMGYFTKYDCSSGDINPIGGLCKNDLKGFLDYYSKDCSPDLRAALEDIIAAPPSAELTGADQRDEEEIGITYNDISILGRVRRGIYGSNGPLEAFNYVWSRRMGEPFKSMDCFKCDLTEQPSTLGNIIKRFFQRYSRNRHKLTTLTPALHAESYSPDDNRFDHRQFLYPPWDQEFFSIDERVDQIRKEINRQLNKGH